MHSLYTALAKHIFIFIAIFIADLAHSDCTEETLLGFLQFPHSHVYMPKAKALINYPQMSWAKIFPSWLEGGLDAVPPGAIFLLSLMKSVQQDLVLVCFCVYTLCGIGILAMARCCILN